MNVYLSPVLLFISSLWVELNSGLVQLVSSFYGPKLCFFLFLHPSFQRQWWGTILSLGSYVRKSNVLVREEIRKLYKKDPKIWQLKQERLFLSHRSLERNSSDIMTSLWCQEPYLVTLSTLSFNPLAENGCFSYNQGSIYCKTNEIQLQDPSLAWILSISYIKLEGLQAFLGYDYRGTFCAIDPFRHLVKSMDPFSECP